MYFHEIKKCFLDRLNKFRSENPLEFNELNVSFDDINKGHVQSGYLNAYHNNNKVFELYIANINPKFRSPPAVYFKAPDGSWISLHYCYHKQYQHDNRLKFTFMSNLWYLGINGRLNVTTESLLNENCPKICDILGIILNSNVTPDNNIQLIAKFNIGDSINETI